MIMIAMNKKINYTVDIIIIITANILIIVAMICFTKKIFVISHQHI